MSVPTLRTAAAKPGLPGDSPSSVVEPALGVASPSRTRMAVVLPAPLGPSRPQTVPSGTASDRPSTAVVSP